MLACGQVAAASDLPGNAQTAAVALAVEAAQALAPAGARVEATPGPLDTRLSLAPCARIDAFLAAGAPAWGRTRVGLRCGLGAVAWKVYLPMQVAVWAPAVVSLSALPAGADLVPSQMEIREVDWAASPQALFTSAADLAGRTLARAVVAGQTLRTGDLQPRQWFAAGETVRVLAGGAGWSVAAEGVALSPGIEGRPARIRLASDRVLSGRPVAERQVEVGP